MRLPQDGSAAEIYLSAVQETQETPVQSLGQEYPLEKEMTTRSSTLAWEIPWTEEAGRLQCQELDTTEQLSNEHTCACVRVRAHTHTHTHSLTWADVVQAIGGEILLGDQALGDDRTTQGGGLLVSV